MGRRHIHVELVNEGFDWAAWITAISSLALAIGLIFALFTLMDARRTRDGELVTDLSRRWDEADTIESLMAYSEEGPTGIVNLINRLYTDDPGQPTASKGDLSRFYTLIRWPTLIDTIGVLASTKAISRKVVYRMWGPQIVYAWDSWREPVARLRELEGYPITYRYFEQLAEDMQERTVKEAKKTPESSSAQAEARRLEAQADEEAEEPPTE